MICRAIGLIAVVNGIAQNEMKFLTLGRGVLWCAGQNPFRFGQTVGPVGFFLGVKVKHSCLVQMPGFLQDLAGLGRIA